MSKLTAKFFGTFICMGIAFTALLIDNAIPSKFNYTTNDGYEINLVINDIYDPDSKSLLKANCDFEIFEEYGRTVIEIDSNRDCSLEYIEIIFNTNSTYTIQMRYINPLRTGVVKDPYWTQTTEYGEKIEINIDLDNYSCIIEGYIIINAASN